VTGPPSPFDNREYWEDRLRRHYSLAGVGYLRLGRRFNEWMYRVRGAVFDRMLDDLAGKAGRGARWSGANVLDVGSGTGFYVERWLRRYRLRRVGSTALQLCYVAAGALAFVHDHRASLWDVAAAATIVVEAGGCMTAPDGAALFPVDPHAYAGEPIGFLAGDPAGHRASLADIVGAPS
jgi:hypothetical protein